MRYQNVKAISEIKFPPGLTVDLEQVDNVLKAVNFSAGGEFLFRVAHDSYVMNLQRIADPKTKEVYRVSGNILGISVLKNFDTEWEAKQEVNRLTQGLGSDSDATLAIDKAKIEVEE